MNIPALKKWLTEPRSALVAAVTDGIRAHVGTLGSRGIEFYGYALLPGELYDIGSLAVATNTEADIKVPRDDSQYYYYRYSVDEWVRYDYDEFVVANSMLLDLNKQFRSMHSKANDDCMMDEFEVAHATVLLDSIVQGLEKAKAGGMFGSAEPFLAVWISDSDSTLLVESVKRLNSTAVAAEFAREFGP